ncbi:MAG: hypothetical protein J6A02_06790 [Prevotella sp.]|nr:hypothetical protein [Prevotella sp.]
MKKVYIKPEAQVVNVNLESALLTMSAGSQLDPTNGAKETGLFSDEEVEMSNSSFDVWGE